MHETFENFSFVIDIITLVAEGRSDSGGLDWIPDRRSAAAFVGMEIDRRQPPVWPESPSGGGLGWQSQPPGTQQRLRCGAFWQADTIGPRGSGQAGEGIGEIARTVRPATEPLGWRGGGGVFAQRVQRRTQTPSSTQLAQATGLCLEASGPPLHPSQQQGSCPFSTRAEKKVHRIVEQSENGLVVCGDEMGLSLCRKI